MAWEVSFEGRVATLRSADGDQQNRLERRGDAVAGAPSIVGTWSYPHYSGATAYERYAADGRWSFRIPLGWKATRFGVEDDHLLLAPGSREEERVRFEVKGDELTLTDEKERVSRFRRVVPADWHPLATEATAKASDETPEGAFARLMRAKADEDVASMLALTVPGDHPSIALLGLYGLAFLLEQKAREGGDRGAMTKDLERLLANHALGTLAEQDFPHYDDALGMTDYALERFGSIDVEAFLEEAHALQRAWQGEAPAGTAPRQVLTDVRIFGDHAVGLVGAAAARFVRRGGHWLADGNTLGWEPFELYVPDPTTLFRAPLLGTASLLDLGAVEALRQRLDPKVLAYALAAPPGSGPGVTARAFLRREHLPEGTWAARLFDAPARTGAETDDLAALVPDAETFAFLEVRVAPEALIPSLLAPDAAGRALWDANLERAWPGHGLDELATGLGLTGRAGVALRRRPGVFDAWRPTSFFDAAEGPETKRPETERPAALLFVLPLAPAAKAAERDAAFERLAAALGAAATPAEHRGVRYRAHEPLARGLSPLPPVALAILDDHLLVSTSEAALKDALDTARDPDSHPPLASRAARADALAYAGGGRGAAASLWIDVSELTRTPDGGGERGGGYLWDLRQAWIQREKDPQAAARSYRTERLAALREKSARAPTEEEAAALEQEVETFVDAWTARYPEFVAEYRRRLLALNQPRSLLFRFTPGRRVLELKLLLTP
jgi:hypothetical protein